MKCRACKYYQEFNCKCLIGLKQNNKKCIYIEYGE